MVVASVGHLQSHVEDRRVHRIRAAGGHQRGDLCTGVGDGVQVGQVDPDAACCEPLRSGTVGCPPQGGAVPAEEEERGPRGMGQQALENGRPDTAGGPGQQNGRPRGVAIRARCVSFCHNDEYALCQSLTQR